MDLYGLISYIYHPTPSLMAPPYTSEARSPCFLGNMDAAIAPFTTPSIHHCIVLIINYDPPSFDMFGHECVKFGAKCP